MMCNIDVCILIYKLEGFKMSSCLVFTSPVQTHTYMARFMCSTICKLNYMLSGYKINFKNYFLTEEKWAKF